MHTLLLKELFVKSCRRLQSVKVERTNNIEGMWHDNTDLCFPLLVLFLNTVGKLLLQIFGFYFRVSQM
jgi:hypothetical protein